MSSQLKDRAAGVIYGQFIGDALGTRYEFKPKDQINAQIQADLQPCSAFLPVLGGGPFDLVPGQVTDDTELACGLAHALISHGKFDQSTVAENYLTWVNSSPFDVGRTTRGALYGNHTVEHIKDSVERFNGFSLSNGSLMRISPLAVFYAMHPELEKELTLKDACYQDVELTHSNPLAKDATYTFVKAIETGIKTGDRFKVHGTALSVAQSDLVKRFLVDATKRAEPVCMESSGKPSELTQPTEHNVGYLGHAMQNAFYEMIFARNFHQGLLRIMQRGGDTDTNGCIAGALMGSIYGKSGIPVPWINTVNTSNPRAEKYPLVDQSNIDQLIDLLCQN